MGMFDKVRGAKRTEDAEDDLTADEALTAPGPQGAGPPAAPGIAEETLFADVDLDDPHDADKAVDNDQGPDDDGGDDLMEIFSSEEEEDVDLAALTQSLEEIDVPSLLSLANDVSTELADFVDPES